MRSLQKQKSKKIRLKNEGKSKCLDRLMRKISVTGHFLNQVCKSSTDLWSLQITIWLKTIVLISNLKHESNMKHVQQCNRVSGTICRTISQYITHYVCETLKLENQVIQSKIKRTVILKCMLFPLRTLNTCNSQLQTPTSTS